MRKTKKPGLSSGLLRALSLLERVLANGASRLYIYCFQAIRPARRAFRLFFDVESRAKQIRVIWCLARIFFRFQCPGFFCAKNLPQIFDASIFLAVTARLDEVGDGDGGEQSNDCDHDHDFD